MDISKLKFVRGGKVFTLPPGFKFHPSEEELIFEYLMKKVFSNQLHDIIIREIDSCNVDPWNLLGERDQESYFFVKKKGNEQNGRETASGYWKQSEMEKKVVSSDRDCSMVGIKKTFAFYLGKYPRGSATEWVLQEYRLACPRVRPSLNHRTKLDKWTVVRVFMRTEEVEGDGDTDDTENFSTSSESSGEFGDITDESDDEQIEG